MHYMRSSMPVQHRVVAWHCLALVAGNQRPMINQCYEYYLQNYGQNFTEPPMIIFSTMPFLQGGDQLAFDLMEYIIRIVGLIMGEPGKWHEYQTNAVDVLGLKRDYGAQQERMSSINRVIIELLYHIMKTLPARFRALIKCDWFPKEFSTEGFEDGVTWADAKTVFQKGFGKKESSYVAYRLPKRPAYIPA
ncbi:hypothetical protein JR316_0011953 [Psilocybe cubensis]|nr:hypothetical protein JR316_0011953 [Psilocybe cubensis]KAH9476378.1 hypothetical protein JR316_0011953 [Psilocybe cubensis]